MPREFTQSGNIVSRARRGYVIKLGSQSHGLPMPSVELGNSESLSPKVEQYEDVSKPYLKRLHN